MNSISEYRRAVGMYLNNCIADNKSPRTVQNYRERLAKFGDFLSSHALECSSESVIRWKFSLSESGMQPSSIAEYLRELRQFCAWAGETGITGIDFTVPDTLIPKAKTRPYEKLLTEQEILAILKSEPLPGVQKRRTWVRDSAVVITLIESAVRASELCAVRPCDLNWETGTVRILHGKGDKQRTAAFPFLAQQAVRKYLDSGLRPHTLNSAEPLFGTVQQGVWTPFTRQWISNIVNAHVKAITGRTDVRSHALRHASASAMLMIGLPKEQIQSVLGHSSVSTTERYIGLLRPESAAEQTSQSFAELERLSTMKIV